MKRSAYFLIFFLVFIFITAGFATGENLPLKLKTKTIQPADVRIDQVTISQFTGRHVLLQLKNVPGSKQRSALLNKGLRLLSPVPENGFLAYLENSSVLTDNELSEICYISEIEASDKIHPRLQRIQPGTFGLLGDGTGMFDVTFHKDVPRIACEYILSGLGARILSYTELLNLYQVRMEIESVAPLAEQDQVLWIAQPTPAFDLLNDKVRVAIGADIAHEAPYNTNGAGVNIMVYDGGIILHTGQDAMHKDLMGRLIIGETDIPDIISHATHVACTAAGTGFASDGKYMGMAPGVSSIVSTCYSPAYTAPIFYNNIGDLETVYRNAIQTYDVQVANNSIGMNIAANGYDCDWEGDYEGVAGLIDSIIYGEYGPIVIVWANGNERGGNCGSGYGTTGPPSPAKNIIAVGATVVNDNSMTSFSSWGPVDDGRIKPDVVAPGDEDGGGLMGGTKSCTYLSLYMGMSGTSMASPAVTGAAALIMEHWGEKVSGDYPSAAMVKALLINGAQDLGNPGPDYAFGFGHIFVPDSLDIIDAGAFTTFTVDQDETFTLRLNSDGHSPIKATLVWSDPPGPPLSARELVNDLNMTLRDPDGETILPFTLNPAAPGATAVRGVDDLNPVEQIVTPGTKPGNYEITVEGFKVPQGLQDAVIVYSGATPCNPDEICDNGVDDNCDGVIDEGCDEDTDDPDDDEGNSSDNDDDKDEGCCG